MAGQRNKGDDGWRTEERRSIARAETGVAAQADGRGRESRDRRLPASTFRRCRGRACGRAEAQRGRACRRAEATAGRERALRRQQAEREGLQRRTCRARDRAVSGGRHPELRRFARRAGSRLRPGARRPLRLPRRRQHRHHGPAREHRIRRRVPGRRAHRGDGPLVVRRGRRRDQGGEEGRQAARPSARPRCDRSSRR